MDPVVHNCGRCRRDADSLTPSEGGFRACPTCGLRVCADCWNLVARACLGCAPFSLPTQTTTRAQRPRPEPAEAAPPVVAAPPRRVRRKAGAAQPARAATNRAWLRLPRPALPHFARRSPLTPRTLATGLAGGGTVLAGIAVATLAFSSLGARPADPVDPSGASPRASAATAGSARPTKSPTHAPTRTHGNARPGSAGSWHPLNIDPPPPRRPAPAPTPPPTRKPTPRPSPSAPVLVTPPPAQSLPTASPEPGTGDGPAATPGP